MKVMILCVLVLCVVGSLGRRGDRSLSDSKPTEARIREQFGKLDADANGKVSREEMKNYLLSGQHPDYKYESEAKVDEQLDKLFQFADVDKDGSLTVEEAIAYVNSPGYDFFGVKTGVPAAIGL